MTQTQPMLPFNHYNGMHLTVHLRGPRTTPQFVATGGLLHAYHPNRHKPLPAYEYIQPPEALWDSEGNPPLPGTPGLPGAGVSYEEEVAGYVEHTAQVLFELIQDTAELERVAARFRRRARPASGRARAVEALHDEQAAVNTYFGEVLEHYCLQLGADAAEHLAQWLAEVAERIDTPSAGRQPAAQSRGPRGFYAVPS